MNPNPAIVIVAYNRLAPLQRLLNAVAKAVYPNSNIELVISIDKSDSNEVADFAKAFEWKHGNKEIIEQAHHLGLKQHILCCGDLSQRFSSVIVLEDDLLVSPWFYHYACEAIGYYKSDEQIAGISLYNYEVTENGFYPFRALNDGNDVYFMQVAASWGQLWTKEQWSAFRAWYAQNPDLTTESALPGYLYEWGKNSWKKHFINYLIATNKYFVFPHNSLSTNFEEAGTNSTSAGLFQVPLQLTQLGYKFSPLITSNAVYDAWFELLPNCLSHLNPALSGYSYSTDLYGTKLKSALATEYVLTSASSDHQPILSFSNELFPALNNVALQLPGKKIGLYKIKGANFWADTNGLKSKMQEGNTPVSPWINVILPVEQSNLAQIQMSLDAIASQSHRWKTCTIVAEENVFQEAERFIGSYKFQLVVLPVANGTTQFKKLQRGYMHSRAEVIVWLNPGSTLHRDSLEKAASIFQYHPLISWLKGVQQKTGVTNSFYRTNHLRLTISEAYSQLEDNKLITDTQGHFMRRWPLMSVLSDDTNQEELFFEMLRVYGQVLAVWQFAEMPQQPRVQPMPVQVKQHLLQKYMGFKKDYNPFQKFLKYWFNSGVLQISVSQWYFPSKENYPDVLRFDEDKQSFYFSKS